MFIIIIPKAVIPAIWIAAKNFTAVINRTLYLRIFSQHIYHAGHLGFISPWIITTSAVNANAYITMFSESAVSPPIQQHFIIGQWMSNLPVQLGRYIIDPVIF